jgi:PAT family beta-lactamase induction signal transducer AmpG
MNSRESFLTTIRSLSNRRIGVIALLGFSSGLPLALTGGTLQAWMSDENVDLKTIGIFTLVGVPYTLKFLWSPFIDRFSMPWLGRRRGWILFSQLALMAFILSLSLSSPANAPWLVAGLAVWIAFTSASQDIVVDAYRTDVLHSKERGLGAAVSVTGYRIAMLVSGGGALVLSDYFGWKMTYMMMAGFMTVGLMATLWGPEPDIKVVPPKTLEEAFGGPFREFFSRQGAIALLALIVLYKLGDAFAGTLTIVFLKRGVGFSSSEVGVIYKGIGLAATILGALFGGVLMSRIGLYRSLMLFGIFQAVTNLSFMVLAVAGKSYILMVTAVTFENLAGGMGTASFVALLMALCDHRFTATQFALLSAFSALGRVFVGPPSGFLAEDVGWVIFFFITFLAALPGLALLRAMKTTVLKLDVNNSQPQNS